MQGTNIKYEIRSNILFSSITFILIYLSIYFANLPNADTIFEPFYEFLFIYIIFLIIFEVVLFAFLFMDVRKYVFKLKLKKGYSKEWSDIN